MKTIFKIIYEIAEKYFASVSGMYLTVLSIIRNIYTVYIYMGTGMLAASAGQDNFSADFICGLKRNRSVQLEKNLNKVRNLAPSSPPTPPYYPPRPVLPPLPPP
jgi:hypothetical protein